jgi:DNA end-binding protein Ku
MAARAIGSATLSFGLVSIPIKLYSASQPNAGVGFNLLHSACGSRIRQQYVCPTCDRVVERKELVRGYEVSKNQYVTFTDDELKAMEAQASRAVDIEQFVPLSAVDPIYFDRAYYVGPDKGAEKAYRLLAESMRAADQVAVAKYVLHGKEHLVVLRAAEHGLVLHTAFFADEVRDQREIDQGGTVSLRDAEMTLARKLIDELAADRFQPEKYEDGYRARVLEAVEAKVAGEEVTAPPAETGRAQVIDLMEALKQSLSQRGTGTGTTPARRPARTKRPAAVTPVRARKGSRK